MRVAIFADVHGNSIALDAVLADIERVGGVDAFWFIGDAADLGFDPAGTVRRIRALPGLRAIRGNADRESTTHVHDTDEHVAGLTSEDFQAAHIARMIQDNSDWTRRVVTATGQFDWLADLPLDEHVTLPDGTRVLLVHAAPGTDQGTGIREEQSDDELGALLAGADADLVIVGHTHIPLDRSLHGVRAYNPGSVSNPVTGDTRAMWTLLEADDTGYRLKRQLVPYNVDDMLERLDDVHHPAQPYIRQFWESEGR